MKIDIKKFCVSDQKSISLRKWPTKVKDFYKSKKDYEKFLSEGIDKLSAQQQLLYATNESSVLIIFQAMDAAGKDGAIQHVMSGINPQGCQVYSFKHPSTTELQHDFLWRTTICLPERGRIGIFNRSYYEEVLITRVHPEILRAEKIPNSTNKMDSLWKKRYKSIEDLEAHLHRNGTRVVKIFLHLSKEEQRMRFLDRIDDKEKNWKFSISDIEERKFWNDYMKAYEDCIGSTSSSSAPWYIVPADDKKNARLIISEIILKTFEELKLTAPIASKVRVEELKTMRELLVNAED